MRFLPALGLAALLAAPAVSAQATIGVKVGIQAANVSFNDEADDELVDIGLDKQARLGFVGGLTADVPLSPSVALRPELLYTQKGFAISYDDADGLDGTVTSQVDYLEVPVLLAYNVVQPNGLAFSIEAGPTLAYKLSSGIGCNLDGELGDATCAILEAGDDDEDGLESFEFGGALGATVGSGPFNVGVRYTQGISNILDNDLADGFEGDEPVGRNSAFTASLIYKFGAY